MTVPIIVILLVGLYLLAGLGIARRNEQVAVFRLGRFVRTSGHGLYWVAPIFERSQKIKTHDLIVEMNSQLIQTRDSVNTAIDLTFQYEVNDIAKAVRTVDNYDLAARQVVLNSLHELASKYNFDELSYYRERNADTLLHHVNKAVAQWGLSVTAIEIRTIERV